ncbi:hypothetical protein OG394_10350 [Kribbella sp. NBC_01245]|uniref:hypothetical protein n=1 Tax=Kribbella sp. NBC_01245 TaxID=2903578 RepID=UPI002E2A96EE|nr:hypothetical protein [Kribbella sp. NBC_01245]
MLMALLAAVLAVTIAPQGATAAPSTPNFPAAIDDYSTYQPQTQCTAVKKGTVALRDLLNRTYGKHPAGLGRDCDQGGTSEHKDGRALDYHFNVYDAGEKADADEFLQWLLETDKYGNKHAMARRLGIMYIIWNRRMWRAYEPSAGWQPYSGPNPHTDHIHFSLSWAGAQQQTTWWTSAGVSQLPRGPLWDRTRWAGGSWDASATEVDGNTALADTAAATLPNGNMYVFNVVPGSGVWYRGRTAAGDWANGATQIDTNGSISAVAATGAPDGSLHVFSVVPGSGIWHRRRAADGTWSTSTHVDSNPYTTAVAAAALPNGTVSLLNVVPGSGVWHRGRTAAGAWAASAQQIDTNKYITSVAAASLGNGTLHVFAVVPDGGIWYRNRTAAGAWAATATQIDQNDSLLSVSAASLPDGTLHVTGVLPGSGVWDRTRTASGGWTNATQIDTNKNIFATYTAGLPNGTLHVGALVNVN